MAIYFLNKKGKRNSQNISFIKESTSGRYGRYYKDNFLNKSQKKMEEEGYEIVDLKPSEAKKLFDLAEKRKKRIEKERTAEKLAERAEQIKICLKAKPIKVEKNTGQFLPCWEGVATIPAENKMDNAYHGCGKGMAYIKENEIVAFHYGHQQPENAKKLEKKGYKGIQVEFSCRQILI